MLNELISVVFLKEWNPSRELELELESNLKDMLGIFTNKKKINTKKSIIKNLFFLLLKNKKEII